MKRLWPLFSFLFFFSSFLFGQRSVIDSLKLTFQLAKHDTARITAYILLGEQFYLQDPDTALSLWQKAEQLSQKNLSALKPSDIIYKAFKMRLGIAYNNIGYISETKGDLRQALEFYTKGLKIHEELGFKDGIAPTMNNIGLVYQDLGETDKALEHFEKAKAMYEQLKDKGGIATSLANMAGIYRIKGNSSKTLENYFESLKIGKEIGNKLTMATAYSNIGGIYKTKGDILRAIEYYDKSLKMEEELNDKAGIAISLRNIGFLYVGQGDLSKGLEYYKKSIKMSEEIGDKRGIGNSLNNMGQVYEKSGNLKMALESFNKSMKIREEIGDKPGIANSLNNLGSIYYIHGDPLCTLSKELCHKKGNEMARDCFKRCLEIREAVGDKIGIASTLLNMGQFYLGEKQYETSLGLLVRSLKLAKDMGAAENIRNAAQKLSMVYKAMGNTKAALVNLELYAKMRDSIENEITRKASIKQQLKYEYQKQTAADSVAHVKESEIKNAQLAKQKAEIKTKKNQQYALYGGLTLVIIFAGFMYNRFKITQRQKSIIEEKEKETQRQNEIISRQKDMVEEKQKEILDSIHYAKRIQHALITGEAYITRKLSELNN